MSMRHLGRMHRGPRGIALLGGIVLLPAIALGLLAFRTLQGEQVREEYQRRERQAQILRLLETDLSTWILSRRGEVEGNAFAFQVGQNRVFLPRLNVYLAPDYQRQAAPRLTSRDLNPWRDAQATELRGGKAAGATESYRRLLSGNPVVSAWSKLALLRLALERADSSDAAAWLKEIQDTDLAAMTESGIPIRVAAALLLIEHRGAASPPDGAGFLSGTLSQLASGRWPLNAAQWTYYAREIGSALDSSPNLRSETLATASFLESLAGAVHEVLALDQSFEWQRGQPFAARLLPGTRSVIVLFPGADGNTGGVLASTRVAREAEASLTALTAAEDFEGRIGNSGNSAQTAAVSLSALPFLEVSFVQRDQTLWRSYLRRYSTFFATAALLLGAGAGLFFTYRAAAQEMEASRMKADFVSSVSHEFRTPLSAIDALLERLESGKVRDEEMLRRYYRASRQEVQRLTGMVNQLLDLSRLNEGRKEFSFRTLDLNQLAEDAIQSFRNLGFGERLVSALDLEGPLNVPADPDAAYQCIHNLIDNALKYSPTGSQVAIGSGRRDGEVFLRVSDRGPGIAPEERELIFEQFYRARTADVGGVQGAGIGLALVKRIMQAHGGTVTLESRLGEGSTFQLTFPEAKA
jgi:signal transduction histidine kinase